MVSGIPYSACTFFANFIVVVSDMGHFLKKVHDACSCVIFDAYMQDSTCRSFFNFTVAKVVGVPNLLNSHQPFQNGKCLQNYRQH